MDYDHIKSLLGSRKPHFTLPQQLYTAAEVHEFDLEAIFSRSWLFVAFDVELPHTGSFLSLTIGKTPILLIRDRQGSVRGFFNTCRHRGAQILKEGDGRCQRIVCPYHQWSYSLEGDLVGARGMERDFDKASFGLRPIRVECVGGTIYVCLSDDAPDFAPFRDAFEPLIQRYNLHEGKVVHQQIIVENANWKLAMENARECAHCDIGHPELCLSLVDGFTVDPADPHNFAFYQELSKRGIPDKPQEGSWFSTGHVPLKPGVKSMTMNGEYDVSKLLSSDVVDLGYLRWSLQAHCYNIALPDYVFTFSVMPIDAQKTRVHSKWLVHKDAVEGVDYHLDTFRKLWETTNNQDIVLTELNQRGVGSIGYQPGPYMPEAEAWCERFTDWYCEEALNFLDSRLTARLQAAE
nr:aromatic ring-hydroxylating dioxygenase subunit alpha [Mesorhizobium sp. WSM4875]